MGSWREPASEPHLLCRCRRPPWPRPRGSWGSTDRDGWCGAAWGTRTCTRTDPGGALTAPSAPQSPPQTSRGRDACPDTVGKLTANLTVSKRHSHASRVPSGSVTARALLDAGDLVASEACRTSAPCPSHTRSKPGPLLTPSEGLSLRLHRQDRRTGTCPHGGLTSGRGSDVGCGRSPPRSLQNTDPPCLQCSFPRKGQVWACTPPQASEPAGLSGPCCHTPRPGEAARLALCALPAQRQDPSHTPPPAGPHQTPLTDGATGARRGRTPPQSHTAERWGHRGVASA